MLRVVWCRVTSCCAVWHVASRVLPCPCPCRVAIVSCRAVLCCALSWHLAPSPLPCHVVPCGVVSCRVVPCRPQRCVHAAGRAMLRVLYLVVLCGMSPHEYCRAVQGPPPAVSRRAVVSLLSRCRAICTRPCCAVPRCAVSFRVAVGVGAGVGVGVGVGAVSAAEVCPRGLSCPVVSCRVVSHVAVPCGMSLTSTAVPVSRRVVSCRVVSCRVVPCRAVPFCALSSCGVAVAVPRRVVSCRVVPSRPQTCVHATGRASCAVSSCRARPLPALPCAASNSSSSEHVHCRVVRRQHSRVPAPVAPRPASRGRDSDA